MADKRPLRKNLVTLLGVAFALGVVLILAEVVFENHNPYSAVVTYMVIPGVISFGLFLVVLGILIEWRRRKRETGEKVLPTIDFNQPRTRRRALVAILALTVFFAVSAVATYRGFVYTESVEFCGTTCHAVMQPEYVAYQNSPHARVLCVECHIGSGADWYARSKVSGLRQVWRTLTDSYEMPIDTPIENLRPARETCQHCHWPEIFTGSVERVEWHFWYDEENTPSRYNMLLHVGGASPQYGPPRGIHWHIAQDHTVRYWASDEDRMVLPWVEVEYADGTTREYRGPDAPEGRPPEAEIRVMDCIDCHNRPTHIYYPPAETVNRALASGRIDRTLPSIKENAVELLSGDYPDYTTARETISTSLRESYLGNGADAARTEAVQQATSELIAIYERTHFPEQGVDWETYPDNIGHMYFPGCFRCHNNEHESADGQVISMECGQCHDFVFQGHGEAAFGPTVYASAPFEHPEGVPDMHLDMFCTDCHGVELAE